MSTIFSSNKSVDLVALEQKAGVILESIGSFAESFGLKPFEIIRADNPDVKSKVRLSENYPSQIPSNHSLVIVAVYNKISSADVNAYIDGIARHKHASLASLNTHRKYIAEHINRIDQAGKNWSSRQAGIAIDKLVSAAAASHLQSLVIRDINTKKLDSALGLTVPGLNSFAIIALFNEQDNGFYFNLASKENQLNHYRYI